MQSGEAAGRGGMFSQRLQRSTRPGHPHHAAQRLAFPLRRHEVIGCEMSGGDAGEEWKSSVAGSLLR